MEGTGSVIAKVPTIAPTSSPESRAMDAEALLAFAAMAGRAGTLLPRQDI